MSELASLLPLIAIFAIFWLLVIRPAQRRQKDVRNVQQSLEVGDQVLTNSGILGTVARVEDAEIGLEVAEGVVIRLARGSVVAVERPADEVDEAPSGDPDNVESTDGADGKES